MEASVTRKFVILSIHPEKGRILIPNTYFRYSLPGAVLMDFLLSGEVALENKRLIHSFRRNGEMVHDLFADMIEKRRPKRISFWVGRMSFRSTAIFRETIGHLASSGIISIEKRYFLNLIPYKRYFFTDGRTRKVIVEDLRKVLFGNTPPSKENVMLIDLLKASRATSLLALTGDEKKEIKKKCAAIGKNDEMASEVDRAICEFKAAVVSSIAISAAVSHGGN